MASTNRDEPGYDDLPTCFCECRCEREAVGRYEVTATDGDVRVVPLCWECLCTISASDETVYVRDMADDDERAENAMWERRISEAREL